MTISVHWDNPEKTIIRMDLRDGWTWALAAERMGNVKAMATLSPAARAMIINVTQVTQYPTQDAQLYIPHVIRDMPVAYIVVIAGGGQQIDIWHRTVIDIYPEYRTVFFKTPDLDAARARIAACLRTDSEGS